MRVNALVTVTALLTLAGCQSGLSTDTKAPFPQPQTPLKAVGQEPGWILKMTNDALSLTYQYGKKQFQATNPQLEHTTNGYRYTAVSSEGEKLILYIDDQYCTDSMSGMPYPYTATVIIGNQTLEGCGGDP